MLIRQSLSPLHRSWDNVGAVHFCTKARSAVDPVVGTTTTDDVGVARARTAVFPPVARSSLDWTLLVSALSNDDGDDDLVVSVTIELAEEVRIGRGSWD